MKPRSRPCPARVTGGDPRSTLLWHHLRGHDAGFLEGLAHRHDRGHVNVWRRWSGRYHGTRPQSPKLPWNKDKSVAGSLGMLLGGWVLTAFILFIFVLKGVFTRSFGSYLLPVTCIAFVATLVESPAPPGCG